LTLINEASISQLRWSRQLRGEKSGDLGENDSARVDSVQNTKVQRQGITKQDQAGLFERFTRFKKSESTDCAGLGLNFVATVVKKHQGKITLDSELNIGTKYTIHLPFLSEEALFSY